MATTTLNIEGMTCGHCVSSVEAELGSLDGVTGVQVDLVPEGVSTATVTADQDIADDVLAQAVTDAGYTVVGTK